MSVQQRPAAGRTLAMAAATAPPDPLDRDHLARLVGRASELRRALTVVAERIATRRSDETLIQRTPDTRNP